MLSLRLEPRVFCSNYSNLSDRWGNERDGGKCRPIGTFHFKFKNNPEKTLAKFLQDITSYQALRTQQWGWTDEHFENFDQVRITFCPTKIFQNCFVTKMGSFFIKNNLVQKYG